MVFNYLKITLIQFYNLKIKNFKYPKKKFTKPGKQMQAALLIITVNKQYCFKTKKTNTQF